MRNHGWQPPYHPLQTVAVAAFLGISLSFYVFFVPFVGSNVLKFHIYAAFSPTVLAVLILYVRCAGCDPADPGVHQSKRAARIAQQREALKSMDDVALSTLEFPHAHHEPQRNAASGPARWLCLPSLACCCHANEDSSTKLNVGEQLLYCSICEAAISRNSKHCKSCDKCVHEFDHHCRWLNNCVGRRNYRTFVGLMVACLLLLIIVWSTGIGVLVRCFTQKMSFEKEIIHRLGSSFSRVPYITVVVLLSLLAMLGTIPLCQLFFFHLILIHKGITTYEYILAIREQGLKHGDGLHSLTSSPASSNSTGVSANSSAGALALHRGVFCTPPRMFVEHHQQVLTLGGDLESSATPAAAKTATKGVVGAAKQPPKKVSVGINPWKLARLNAAEAAQRAAQAREASSTILRRITVTETDDTSLESSRDVSGEITSASRKHDDLVCLTGKEKWLLMKDARGQSIITTLSSRPSGIPASHSPQSMVPWEARNYGGSPSRFSGEMRASYAGSSHPGSSHLSSQWASPDIFQGSPDQLLAITLPKPSRVIERTTTVMVEEPGNVDSTSESTDEYYEASAGESGEENYTGRGFQELENPLTHKSNLDASVQNTPNEKVAVREDNVKPRGFRSSGCSTGARTVSSSSGSRAEANILRHVRKEWPELRDRLSVSPVDSHESYFSPFSAPLHDSLEPTPARDSSLPREATLVSAINRFKGKQSISRLTDGATFSEAAA